VLNSIFVLLLIKGLLRRFLMPVLRKKLVFKVLGAIMLLFTFVFLLTMLHIVWSV